MPRVLYRFASPAWLLSRAQLLHEANPRGTVPGDAGRMDFHGVFAALDEVWFVTGQGDGRPSKVIAGRILRAGSVEQQALVATMPQALGHVEDTQVLTAGHVQFVPVHVAVDGLYATQEAARQQTGFGCDYSPVIPEFSIEVAISAFTVAVEAGFVSANSEGPRLPVSTSTVSSFAHVEGGRVGPQLAITAGPEGAADIGGQLAAMMQQQAVILERLGSLEQRRNTSSGTSRVTSTERERRPGSGHVSFGAAEGVAATRAGGGAARQAPPGLRVSQVASGERGLEARPRGRGEAWLGLG